jgi:hypothetical protein
MNLNLLNLAVRLGTINLKNGRMCGYASTGGITYCC